MEVDETNLSIEEQKARAKANGKAYSTWPYWDLWFEVFEDDPAQNLWASCGAALEVGAGGASKLRGKKPVGESIATSP